MNTSAGGNETQLASHSSIFSTIDVSLVSDLRQGIKQRRSSPIRNFCTISLDYFLGKAAPNAISAEHNVLLFTKNVPLLNRKVRQNARLINIFEKPSPYKSNRKFQLTIYSVETGDA